jgi:hypothetical protein
MKMEPYLIGVSDMCYTYKRLVKPKHPEYTVTAYRVYERENSKEDWKSYFGNVKLPKRIGRFIPATQEYPRNDLPVQRRRGWYAFDEKSIGRFLENELRSLPLSQWKNIAVWKVEMKRDLVYGLWRRIYYPSPDGKIPGRYEKVQGYISQRCKFIKRIPVSKLIAK